MCKFLFVLIFILIGQSVFAQTSIDLVSSRKINPRDTLDKAKLCVHYRQAERDNLLDTNKVEFSEMVLQIGEHCSNYTNYIRLWSDSIKIQDMLHTNLSSQQIRERASDRVFNCGDWQTVFKNHPQGKYLVQDLVFLDRYLYEESIPHFNWKLESGTLIWLGYVCKKATCDFRGRHYTAWYAPKIAINNGPWKFNGLPGLILKVEDAKGDYVFEATELYKVTWGCPIYYIRKSNQMKVTRERFLQAQKRDKENPVAALQNSGKIVGEVKEIVLPKCKFNPIELDF